MARTNRQARRRGAARGRPHRASRRARQRPVIERGAAGLGARTIRILVDQRPRRIRGRVGDGLYWSLRASGVSPQAAGDYLKALATRLDVGADLGPDDRFDLVIATAARRPARSRAALALCRGRALRRRADADAALDRRRAQRLV
jgi:hypothetical protein